MFGAYPLDRLCGAPFGLVAAGGDGPGFAARDADQLALAAVGPPPGGGGRDQLGLEPPPVRGVVPQEEVVGGGVPPAVVEGDHTGVALQAEQPVAAPARVIVPFYIYIYINKTTKVL